MDLRDPGDLRNPLVIERWAAQRIRTTALERRREPKASESELRAFLRAGAGDWFRDRDKRCWRGFAARAAALGVGASDLGFAIAVLLHNLVTEFHLGPHANTELTRNLLAQARAGEVILAFAASEPEGGAHPRTMRSWGERVPGGWRLTGRKTFVTNGGLADEIVVIAVCSGTKVEKHFGAFVVAAEAPGVSRRELTLPLCSTASHAEIELQAVGIPDDRVLVLPDGALDAYHRLMKPLRGIEDLAVVPMMFGHLQWMEHMGEHLPREARGRLRALLAGIATLIENACERLDLGLEADTVRLAIPYLLEPAIEIVRMYPAVDPLWQACATDLEIAKIGANVRRRFYEKLAS